MHTIKTVETQVPFLKESFFTTTFKGRRKSSVTHILHKQNSLLNQQQCILEHQQHSPEHFHPSPVGNGKGQQSPEHQRLARSVSSPLCKTPETARADGDRKEGQREREREAAQGRRGEPAAVSASLLLLSASAELGKPTSSSQLPLTVVGKQQGLASSGRALTSHAQTSAAAKEETQHAPSRPQQHGLLAKGVRLLKNMGNQETKQKKGGGSAGAAGDVSCEAEADEREVDKSSKKSHNKATKGEHSGKKKPKSESKGSVFSGMKIRKSLSKVKGLSKDDMLEDGRLAQGGKDELKSRESVQLVDDMGIPSDVDGDLSCMNADNHHSVEQEFGRKTSSASDADLYSFHSATAETEDLLSDIQQAIRNQYVASDKVLGILHSPSNEGLTLKVSEIPETALSPQQFNLDAELFSPSSESESVLQHPENRKIESENGDIPISRNSSCDESGSIFPKTNSTYSFQDTTATTTSYESADEQQDDLESPVLHQQSNMDMQNKNSCVSSVHLDPVSAGTGPIGTHKSASSMDLTLEREEEDCARQEFLSLTRRKSSMSISQLTTDSPPVSQSRRTSANSPSTVRLYPPVHPSYVKTTTRQLTSPVGSPITSPNVPRKTDATVASLESSKAEGFSRRKQRSCSIAGPHSVSDDWSAELDEPGGTPTNVTKSQEPETVEKSHSGGTYWTLGSRRSHYGKKTSVPYLDVFSGKSHMK